MATITRYVDPNAAAGGDGTTNGLSGSTCAYASMAIWEAAQQQDLTDGGGDIAECICSSNGGAADTTSVTIDGWTTGASSYITIYAAPAYRHAGVWDTGKYRRTTTDTSITISEAFVRVNFLQVSVNDAFASCIYVNVSGANGDVRIGNNIVRANTTGLRGIYFYWIGTGGFAYDNIVYDFLTATGRGIGANVANSCKFYNNTIHNCTIGLAGGSDTPIAINNLLAACTTPASGTFAAGTDYNATDDASIGYTVTGGGNTHDRVSQTFTFADESGDDFHLDTSDAGARDFGVSDPGSGLFGDDIDGETRTGSWDIGADEYVAGGGIEGQASLTQDAQSLSSTGTVSIAGSASITQAAQAIISSGAVGNSGTADISQAEQTVSATGVIAIQGLANITQAAQTIIATGFITRLVDAPHTSIHIRPSAFTIVGGFGSGSGPGMGQSGFLQGVGIYQ